MRVDERRKIWRKERGDEIKKKLERGKLDIKRDLREGFEK
jgi:hypothetical protein